MVYKIKSVIRTYFFRKEMKKRQFPKRVTGLKEAKSVGILYDASEQETFKQVISLAKKLNEEGKKVWTMGFYRQKHRPAHLIEQLQDAFCHRKDFGWNLKLKSTVLEVFANKGFDILIDLSSAETFLMKFMSAYSYARYKIGTYHPEMVDLYDLMIESEKPLSISEMIDHSIHYLKLIKNPHAHE